MCLRARGFLSLNLFPHFQDGGNEPCRGCRLGLFGRLVGTWAATEFATCSWHGLGPLPAPVTTLSTLAPLTLDDRGNQIFSRSLCSVPSQSSSAGTAATELDLTGCAQFIHYHQGGSVGGGLPGQGAAHLQVTVTPSSYRWGARVEGDLQSYFQMRSQGPERVSDLPEATQLESGSAQPSPGLEAQCPFQALRATDKQDWAVWVPDSTRLWQGAERPWHMPEQGDQVWGLMPPTCL